MKKALACFGILLAICLLFFYPIFKSQMPFPGDLLIDSNPYRSLSVLGFLPGSYPNKAQGMDVITEMYPWRYFTIQELKQGRIPFWNPHNFSGNIHMQNLQSSVFNPFNFLFFLFSFNFSWTLFILIQPILASFFFFLFARELKLSRFASIVGAVGFAFSQYMTVWIEYGNIAATLSYLPLLLFFLLRFSKKQTKTAFIGFVVGSVMMLLSGYIQGAFYSYLVAGAFAIVLVLKNKKILFTAKNIVSLVSMFFLPVVLTSFQLVPTLQVFSQSSRWPYSLQQFQNLLQPWWYWVTLLSSDFFGNPATRSYYLPITYIERVAYIGVPLLIFAVFGMLHKKPFVHFFFIVAVFVLLMTTNIPCIAYLYLLPIPVIDTTVPTRFLSIFMFAMVVLATYGVDSFFHAKEFPKKIVSVFGSIYILLWIGVVVVQHFYPKFLSQLKVTEHNLVIPSILFGLTVVVLFFAKKFPLTAKIVLLTLVVADLFFSFQKITPFAPSEFAYPQSPVVSYLQKNAGINRYWGYGSGYIFPNIQTVTGTYSPEGNDPLHMRSYGELLASSYDGKLPVLPPRPDANLAQGFGQDGLKNHYRQVLLNLLGVKYVVQHDETIPTHEADSATFPKEEYQLVWSQNPWQIYENISVFPRYFLVNSTKVASGQKALDLLYSLNLRNTAILGRPLSLSLDSSATGEAKLLSYSPQKIVFHTNTTGRMMLFLSDTYFPSWKVAIDGKQASIELADYSFRGVVVPQGQHTIIMYYQPTYFVIGLFIAGIGLLLFFACILFFV